MEDANTIRREADTLRERTELAEAGDRFTQASYRYLSLPPYGADIRNSDIGQGLYCLLSAALCYRVAQKQTRARNRCRQGILLAADLREYVTDEPALTGLLYECQGDFQCIEMEVTGGSSAESAESYARASDQYSDVPTLDMWQSEPAFEWLYAFFVRTGDAASVQVADRSELHRNPETRVGFKQKQFQSIIQMIVDAGEWQYDRSF